MNGHLVKDGYSIDGYADGYSKKRDSRPTYFDAKREIKKIYGLGLKAIQRKDQKYINFLLLNLDELERDLKDKFNINAFGWHILKKDIDGMRHLLTTRLKKKIKEDAANEKKGPRNL